MNHLYYGDNLDVRRRYIPDESLERSTRSRKPHRIKALTVGEHLARYIDATKLDDAMAHC